jgi:uncharacterized membrane protein SpoIIM required for sporulation
MDVDAYVSVHEATWQRLRTLLARPGRLRGAELDEVVDLYQRASTHLSVVRTGSSDPVLVGELTALVARARGVVAGRRPRSWSQVGRFLSVTFPAMAWRCRWWWLGAGAATLLLAGIEATWIVHSATVQASLLAPQDVSRLVDEDFAGYYHAAPHSSFAAQVWTNNALLAAQCLVSGLLLGLPVIYLIAHGHGGQFFALVLPHGLLELTAVFLAAGAGLRLGWTLVAPGPRSRVTALAQEGRATVALAGGLTVALLVSGLLEGFVTPSGIPPVPRIAIGAVAWLGFLAWTLVLGRRAVLGGHDGDLQDRPRVLEQG